MDLVEFEKSTHGLSSVRKAHVTATMFIKTISTTSTPLRNQPLHHQHLTNFFFPIFRHICVGLFWVFYRNLE